MTTDTLFVTVVVPTRDRAALLDETLRALCALDYPAFEIVVVDQSADETTRDVVRRVAGHDPRVRVERARPEGSAAARNVGVAAARGAIVAFTDDDCIVERGWLRSIAAELSDPRISAVYGRVLPHEAGPRTGREVGFKPTPRRVEYARRVPPWYIGHGGNMAFRRAALLEIGTFDTLLGAGGRFGAGEDGDIAYRLLAAGKRVAYSPHPLAYHRHRHWKDWPAQQRMERAWSRLLSPRLRTSGGRADRRGPLAAQPALHLRPPGHAGLLAPPAAAALARRDGPRRHAGRPSPPPRHPWRPAHLGAAQVCLRHRGLRRAVPDAELAAGHGPRPAAARRAATVAGPGPRAPPPRHGAPASRRAGHRRRPGDRGVERADSRAPPRTPRSATASGPWRWCHTGCASGAGGGTAWSCTHTSSSTPGSKSSQPRTIAPSCACQAGSTRCTISSALRASSAGWAMRSLFTTRRRSRPLPPGAQTRRPDGPGRTDCRTDCRSAS